MTPKSRAAILYAHGRGYLVLDDGALLGPQGNVMRPTPSGEGYPTFKVGPHGRQRTVLLQYCWYVEAALEAECVRHRDDVRTNCTRGNILIGSRSDNSFDIPREIRQRNGRQAAAAKHGRTAEVRHARNERIAELRAGGMSREKVAKLLGVSLTLIKRVSRERKQQEQ